MTYLSIDEAIQKLRSDPAQADLVHYAYFDEDIEAAAKRFQSSEEFTEVFNIISKIQPKWETVLDLGAGNGIASYAFAESGTKLVYALEPDSSDLVGRGAIEKIKGSRSIELINAFGEQIPLPDACVDIVYVRQVLHHTRDLPQVLRECARVLKMNGVFIACREHVVDDAKQLQLFLNAHPIHKYTGGENAYMLSQYKDAIKMGNLKLLKLLGQYDSVINAYPTLTKEDMENRAAAKLEARFGKLGGLMSKMPGISSLVAEISRRRDRSPGRLYSFVAVKKSF